MALYNFRQFKDLQEIEFSQDEQQNITLILGDNTSGKTTLLQAFLWCFYGTANFEVKDLLNEMVAEEIKQTEESVDTYVSIDLEHQGTNYYITRKLNHFVRNGVVVPASTSKLEISYLDKSGETEKISPKKTKEKMGEILPKNLSMYFLYDTERFGNVSSREDVTRSVKHILGLSVLEELIEYLSSSKYNNVLKQLRANLDLEDSEQAQEAYDLMNKYEAKITDAKEKIDIKKNEITYYEEQITKKQEILRGLEKTAAYQQEIDKNAKALSYEQEKLESSIRGFYSSFQNNTYSFLGKILFSKAREELINAKLDTKTIRDMNANAIKDIIKRGYCVCGAEVCEGNHAYKNLQTEMEYLPPESIGTLLKMFKDQLDIHANSKNNYFTILDGCYKNIVDTQERVNNLEDDIKQIEQEIMNLGQEDIQAHQQELNAYVKKRTNLQQDIDMLNQEIGEFQSEYTKNESTHRRLTLASAKNKKQYKYIKYTEAILQWAQEHKDARETVIRSQLEEKVNHYFNQIYHGNRKVVIDDKFRVHLMTTDSNIQKYTDESKGLETVKNFSFISGLVDMAKQKIQDNLEAEAVEYPLILDAPFSNADETHVRNISNVLPNVANQLILIVMAKDWNYAKEELGNRIGKEYYLEKNSEIYTTIKGGALDADI